MSNSKVRVTIRSADPVANVMLLDRVFNTVSRGIGELKVDVEPGMYLARATVANRAEEMPIALRADVPESFVTLPLVHFDSPIPLDHTRTTRERHMGLVSRALRASFANPTKTTGGFLLCVRDAAFPPLSGSRRGTPADSGAYKGFRLLDLKAAVAVDFDSLPGALRIEDGLLLHATKLAAGNYQLEWRAAEGPAMQLPVIIRPTMTTQVYVLAQSAVTEVGHWKPDLANAAVAFASSEHGVRFDDPEMRLAEQARYCLSGGANMIGSPRLDEMLCSKFENPMLGVLGAHLLLLEKEPRVDLIGRVITNTGELLGQDFPDLVALKLKLASTAPGGGVRRFPKIAPVVFPPLLRRSWDYLLDAAVTMPGLFPADSFATRISGSIVSSGIWLAWRPCQDRVEPYALAVPTLPSSLPADSGASSALANKLRFAVAISDFTRKVWESLRGESSLRRGGMIRPTTHVSSSRREQILGGKDEPEQATVDNQEHDLVDRVQALVEVAVSKIEWDTVIGQLRRREASRESAVSLSEIEKALLAALQFTWQYREDGGKLDRRYVEGLARSLAVPMSVMVGALQNIVHQLVPAEKPNSID